MKIHRISAFSDQGKGGNPAGVVLLEAPLEDLEMARMAAEVGYSETAFAVRPEEGSSAWRVRYFAPEAEVPFCGHATIALGAVLGEYHGTCNYYLALNDADISVEAMSGARGMAATLTSPSTRSEPASETEVEGALDLLGLTADNLDAQIPPARIHAGADHLVLSLTNRQILASMHYDLDTGRAMMRRHGFVTIMLVFVESANQFSVRNAFASGGVVEDPATGAAAAALAGYLRDLGWPHGGRIAVRQGEDSLPTRSSGKPARDRME